MITLLHVYYKIHDEVSKNDEVHNSFIKNIVPNLELVPINSQKKYTQYTSHPINLTVGVYCSNLQYSGRIHSGFRCIVIH